MQPASECCILQANTQVIVAPKSRHYSSTSNHKQQNVPEKKSDFESTSEVDIETHIPAQSESKDNSQLTVLDRAVRWLGSLWHGEQLPATDVVPPIYRSEIWTGPRRPTCVCQCRILPLEEFTFMTENCSNKQTSSTDLDDSVVDESAVWPALKQPLNVFIGLKTVANGFSFYSHSDIPVTFLAVLRSLASPSDKLAAAKDKERSGKTAQDVSTNISEGSSAGAQAVVRVVILNLNGQIAVQTDVCLKQVLPEGHVLISSMLRRQLSMSVKGRVTIEPLTTARDFVPLELLCYPLYSAVC